MPLKKYLSIIIKIVIVFFSFYFIYHQLVENKSFEELDISVLIDTVEKIFNPCFFAFLINSKLSVVVIYGINNEPPEYFKISISLWIWIISQHFPIRIGQRGHQKIFSSLAGLELFQLEWPFSASKDAKIQMKLPKFYTRFCSGHNFWSDAHFLILLFT